MQFLFLSWYQFDHKNYCNLIHDFRKYALRRIHDGFKKNKNLSDHELIDVEYKEALMNLEVIKRQASYFFGYIGTFIHN